MNIDIKKQAEQLLELCDTLQKDYDIYKGYELTLAECTKLEWQFYLLHLGFHNKTLNLMEIRFLRDVLDITQSKEALESMYYDRQLGSEQFSNKIPRSVQEFVRIDLKNKDNGKTTTFGQLLVNFYKTVGQTFIACNSNITNTELKDHTDYTTHLQAFLGQQSVDKNLEPGLADKEAAPTAKEPDYHAVEQIMEEINELVGLEKVKEEVASLINLVKIQNIRKQRELPVTALSLHMVFSGNPGTGKTTIARKLSQIYYNLGLLSKGHLVEVERSALVGGYVGQTAIKTKEVVESAYGGILFIDEAYTLTANKSSNDFGQEAVDTLLKLMEDNRDKIVVIVAGYTDLMEEFLNSNPGLKSRFNKFIFFEDYTAEQLTAIFEGQCGKSKCSLTEEAKAKVLEHFTERCDEHEENFANARESRNLFERAITAQANRLASLEEVTDEQLLTIELADIEAALS